MAFGARLPEFESLLNYLLDRRCLADYLSSNLSFHIYKRRAMIRVTLNL